MGKATVALIDDHPMLRDGVRHLFSDVLGYEVVGEGGSASDAVAISFAYRPDYLFIDLSMPGDAFAAISEMRSANPLTKIAVFTAVASVDCAIRALEAGANGYLLKGSSARDIVDAMTCMNAGQSYITPSFAAKVIAAMSQRARSEQRNAGSRLNAREMQIAGLLQQGLTNREIGVRLSISEKTVRHYMTLIMRKLDVRNRVEVALAIRDRMAAPGTMRKALTDIDLRVVS